MFAFAGIYTYRFIREKQFHRSCVRLCNACILGDLEAATQSLNRIPLKNINPVKYPVLLITIMYNQRDIIHVMLQHSDVDLYQPIRIRDNALFVACEHNKIAIVSELLRYMFISSPQFPFLPDTLWKIHLLKVQLGLSLLSGKFIKRLGFRSKFITLLPVELIRLLYQKYIMFK